MLQVPGKVKVSWGPEQVVQVPGQVLQVPGQAMGCQAVGVEISNISTEVIADLALASTASVGWHSCSCWLALMLLLVGTAAPVAWHCRQVTDHPWWLGWVRADSLADGQ